MPPMRDAQKQKLLEWKQARAEAKAKANSAVGVDDDKQRILQRRKEMMAPPSLKRLAHSERRGGRVEGERHAAEGGAEAAARSDAAQEEADAAPQPERRPADKQQTHGGELELKARASEGEASESSMRSASAANDSDGGYERSEPGAFRDSDEENPHGERPDDAIQETLTQSDDDESVGNLAGSYFTLDPLDVPLEGRSPRSDEVLEAGKDDELEAAEDGEQRTVILRTVEEVDVDVDIRARRSVETVKASADPDKHPTSFVDELSDLGAAIPTTEQQAAAEDSAEHPRASSNAVVSDQKAAGERGRFAYVMVLMVAVLSVGVATGGVAIWCDPTSPLARTVKHTTALAVTTAASTVLDSAHWAENLLHQSAIAPAVQKLAAQLESLVESAPRWSTIARVHLQSIVADGWHGVKASMETATSDSLEVYHSLARRAANVTGSVKRYLSTQWTDFAFGGRLAGGDEHAAFADLLAGERVRMAAIKQQLDHQEAWVLKELERMKTRRAAYSSATDSLLSESREAISDGIHEARDAAVRSIKMFREQIVAALKRLDHAAVDTTTAGQSSETPETPKAEEGDAQSTQPASPVRDEGDRPPLMPPKGSDGRMEALEDAAARVYMVLDDEAEIARATRLIEEMMMEADTAAAVQELEAQTYQEEGADAETVRAAARQVQESAEVLADVSTQRKEAQDAVSALFALESGVTAGLTAAQAAREFAAVEVEEHRTQAADALSNLELAYARKGADDALGNVDTVREELLRIAKEEALELEITTVKVAAELLKTGADIEDDTVAFREQLEAARTAAESGAMESVCTDAHCLADSEAIEHVCDGVRCAAISVQETLESVGASIDAVEQDAALSDEGTKPYVEIVNIGDQVLTPEVADIASLLIPKPHVNITAGIRVASTSLTHIGPIALLSAVFLGLAAVSGIYLRRAWRRRQQRIARHLRWRRRLEQKRWPTGEEDGDEDVEEVVLMSGPSMETSAAASDSQENDTASASSPLDGGADDATADEFEDKEEAEGGVALGASGLSSAQGIQANVVSQVELSHATLASASSGPQPTMFMSVTHHTAQRALLYSPDGSDSASP